MKKNKLWELFELLQKDNYAKDLSPKTIENYGYYLTRIIKRLESRGIKNPEKISDLFIQDFKYEMRIDKLENESTNSYLKALRRYLNFGYQKGYVKCIPKIELLREVPKAKPTLSDVEVEKLFSNCDLSVGSVLAILYLGTGIRSRTMSHLRTEDFDYKQKLLTCRVTKNRKTLILPLPESLCELLKAYIKKHKKEAGEWLFVNSFGTQYRKTSMYTTMNKFYEANGIAKTGVHLLRHTFGKLMVMNHCDAFTLMHWFGHSKTEETKRYVNLFANELSKTVEMYNPTASWNFVSAMQKNCE